MLQQTCHATNNKYPSANKSDAKTKKKSHKNWQNLELSNHESEQMILTQKSQHTKK